MGCNVGLVLYSDESFEFIYIFSVTAFFYVDIVDTVTAFHDVNSKWGQVKKK